MVAKGSSSTVKKLLCVDTIAAMALCSSTLTSLLNSEYGLRQTLVIIRLPKAHQRLFVRSYARAFQGVSEISQRSANRKKNRGQACAPRAQGLLLNHRCRASETSLLEKRAGIPSRLFLKPLSFFLVDILNKTSSFQS